ncbi:MAG: hypothetical protein EAZ15_10650 [Sphingobacteriales bacterium]|nr:MAG: hypothetical protein EAZ15_10650 [Sphingobacteriales bacterium]
MKNLILTLIIPFCILFTSVSCKKSNALKYGGFSCKVNGQLWEPYVDDFKLQPTECTITQEGKSIFIRATNTKKRERIVLLVSGTNKIITVGKFALNSKSGLVGYFYNVALQKEFTTGSGYVGEIDILKIDKGTKKISGKFYFNCYKTENNETLSITDGEFNIKYLEY